MPGRLGFTMLDYSNERAAFSLATGNVTGASLPGLLTEVGQLRTAIEGITLGVVAKENLSVFDTTLSSSPPGSQTAQNEKSWLVTYRDNLPFFDDPVNAIPNEGYGRLFTMTIPTADDVNVLLQPESDFADLTDTEMAAFVTAFENTARSPYGGTVEVRTVRFVGRNR